MAIRYQVTWFDSMIGLKAREHKTLWRRDAADRAIYDMARDMVASWAGLDTQWGWDFMRDVMAQETGPLPIGQYRTFTKRLPQGDELVVWIERV